MNRMSKTVVRALLVSVLGGTAVMAQAQGIDLNRLFSIGREALTAVAGVSEQDEQTMGREIAGRMLGAAPLVNDTARFGRLSAMIRLASAASAAGVRSRVNGRICPGVLR